MPYFLTDKHNQQQFLAAKNMASTLPDLAVYDYSCFLE